MEDNRPDWNNYLMGFAKHAALRGNCLRAKVGVILVQDKRIIATGYGGALPGLPTCTELGYCDMLEGHCVRTVHAEMNALIQAAQSGMATKGATLYCTVSPCWSCFRVLYAAGITKMVSAVRYWHAEHVERVTEVLQKNPHMVFDVWSEIGAPLATGLAGAPPAVLQQQNGQ